MADMVRKKIQKVKEGYSPKEARELVHAYIKESMEHLRLRLREEWRRGQATEEKSTRHGVKV